MQDRPQPSEPPLFSVVQAAGEASIFNPGDAVRILGHSPIGHYRVPVYLRGKNGLVEAVIEPAAVDNEAEGYGRNAGSRRHYYRVAISMSQIWPDYAGSLRDGLRVEVFETWLERV